MVWEDRSRGGTRIVEGRLARLKETRLVAAGRVEGPYRLRLSCASG
jgi:hypothetical protein